MHLCCFPAALSLMLLASSCTMSRDGGAKDLGVGTQLFQDVVVPAGLTLDERHYVSHSAEDSGWRFAHYACRGTTRVDEACSYLLERMPQHRWDLVADQQVSESSRIIKFKRGRYVVAYSFERTDGLTRLSVDYDTQISAEK